MNRPNDSTVVNLQISAASGRVDAAFAGRVAQAVVSAMLEPPARKSQAATVTPEPPKDSAAAA